MVGAVIFRLTMFLQQTAHTFLFFYIYRPNTLRTNKHFSGASDLTPDPRYIQSTVYE